MSRLRFQTVLLFILCSALIACSGGSGDDPVDAAPNGDAGSIPDSAVGGIDGSVSESCSGSCTNTEFCDFEPNNCGSGGEAGVCEPRPEACLDIYDPVCGCDGITYGNGCEANVAGTDVQFEGTCQQKACSGADPCVLCAVGLVPETEEDCYCLGCGSIPMPQSECQSKTLAYTQVCSEASLICPLSACTLPPPVNCDGDGVCVLGDPRF